MPRDSRLTKPEETIMDAASFYRKDKGAKINYAESFAQKGGTGEPPFNINRFGPFELKNKLVTRKLSLNPRLNFVGDNPESFELFSGLGRFDAERGELYNFDEGRANTRGDFRRSPDYNPMWEEFYRASPSIPPPDKVTNPMPRLANPDPRGFIMGAMKAKAEREVEGDKSVAQLLEGDKK